MSPVQSAVKRVMDAVIAAGSLVALSPLCILIALLVRLDTPGPVVFRQRRVGRNGEVFTLYKFRTMSSDAPDVRNPDGSTFNAESDPRVTRVGRILRRASLDELPQLANVLKGDMSLVGPRPDLPDHLRHYSERDKKRLLVKPGLTGWASVHGRNSIPWQVRRELDVQYVEAYSLRMDLLIMVRTIPTVLLGKGLHIPPELANRFSSDPREIT